MVNKFHSEIEEGRIQHVRLVLRHLPKTAFVNIEKRPLHVPTVAFLVLLVKQGQLTPDPPKIQAVAE